MRTKTFGFLLVLAFSVSAEATRPQDSLTRAQGLMITRMVLSIEGNAGREECLDLSAVMKLAQDPSPGSPSRVSYFARDLATTHMVDPSTATVMDYTLQLTRSNDKKHYQMSLTPTTPKSDERLSWFSDDRGIIYVAQHLDVAPAPTPAPSSLTSRLALLMMRSVMNIEVGGYETKEPKYFDLAEVVSRSERDPGAWKMADGETRSRIVEETDANTAPVQNYTLLLTVSSDKRHYQASLTPPVPTKDSAAWFCDDRTLIYVGKPIG